MNEYLRDFEADYQTFKQHQQDYLKSLAADDSDVLYRKYPRHLYYNMANIAWEDACYDRRRFRHEKAKAASRAS